MPRIVPDVCTVIVTMNCQPQDQHGLIDAAAATEQIFARQPGFVSSTIHRSVDGSKVLQYLQWESQEASDACMMSPDWQSEPAQRFMELVQQGKATMEPAVYEIVSIQDGPANG